MYIFNSKFENIANVIFFSDRELDNKGISTVILRISLKSYFS